LDLKRVNDRSLTIQSPVVATCTTRFKYSTFYQHSATDVFRIDLRTNSDNFPIPHYRVGFYNRDEVYSLRGTT